MPANEIVDLLIRMNLAAAATIGAVIVMRKPVRRLFGARLAYSLWLLPVLGALAMLIPARRVVLPVAAPVTEPAASPPVSDFAPLVPEVLAPSVDPAVLILIGWAGGVLVAGLLMTGLQRRFMAEARTGRIGPAVVGVISPRIVTPADFANRFTPDERALVLAHEQAHIARQDSRLNALSAVIQCLFWFNPLVHLAAHLARIDQELACDEAVVTRFPEARGDYARALVKAQLAIRPLPLGCYWPSGTEHPLLERIAMLKLEDVGPVRRLAGVMCLTVACTGAGVAAWAAQPAVTVFAAAPAVLQWKRVETPEMRPTGVMIPAFGSHPPGTPPDQIRATTAEMTPTGAMRVVMEPVAMIQPPAGAPVTPQGYTTIQNALTEAEARGERISVEGDLVRVQFVNPQALITIRDASGQEITVASETPNSLLRQGVNRLALQPGMKLRMDGYRGADGSVQARAAGFSSNGVRLATSDSQGNPLPAQQAPGAVIDRSPLSNSVVREGAPPPAAPITPPERPAIITNPEWKRLPNGEELSGVYPERGLRMEKSGSVRLNCAVQVSGALSDCVVMSESPEGLGFGEAAKQLQDKFQLKPQAAPRSLSGGTRVNVPVRFSLD